VSSDLNSKASKERAAVVLIPLLILQLALLSLQIENPSGVLLFKSWTLAVQAPLVAVSSGITGGIQRLWRNYFWMVGARAENAQLKESVHRLSLLNNSYEQIRQENIRLRRLLALAGANSLRTVGSRVVARTPSFLSNVIYINSGSADGVHIDAPVLSGDGIIGRAILVTKHQSQVQLITNPDASLGVIIERTRTPGVLRGTGDVLLDLNFIGNTEQVNIGDVVLSSGLDGIYPKGLPIGKVVDSRKGKGVFRSIKVEPGIDLIRLEEVSVLLQESSAIAPENP
jgi:rod shape-determining protein MreC